MYQQEVVIKHEYSSCHRELTIPPSFKFSLKILFDPCPYLVDGDTKDPCPCLTPKPIGDALSPKDNSCTNFFVALIQ